MARLYTSYTATSCIVGPSLVGGLGVVVVFIADRMGWRAASCHRRPASVDSPGFAPADRMGWQAASGYTHSGTALDSDKAAGRDWVADREQPVAGRGWVADKGSRREWRWH